MEKIRVFLGRYGDCRWGIILKIKRGKGSWSEVEVEGIKILNIQCVLGNLYYQMLGNMRNEIDRGEVRKFMLFRQLEFRYFFLEI